ncbi:ammonium transporter [Corynebacterium belfantii]|uniref:ammonium transporter n=1 Tax=Corynebacterium belfantii TaxID=2014537 RepID=UPI000965B9EB|nr:ammonium transporter [Corynebacterium belfantii]OLN15651.1 hypothetical protein BUE64_06425 [Corynebacterium diphtheriae subsp. lausannense]MBG9243305.1 ammonium transporter [Corynebacterium belfantii]MBG9288782.1 ammonium transporter [Corynebacterium belfantii]MBG9309299.1 ammonium transporter [Corynebacterium belfantii]MBG9326978.1 ammonium transporter [Corynebacterium belfantii]
MDDDVRNIGIAYDTALAFFYGGMLGQKSVLNMLMMSYGALAVVVVAYIGWGAPSRSGTRVSREFLHIPSSSLDCAML